MIKEYPLQFTLTLILFLIINTSYFWEGEFGILISPIFIVLFMIFFILSIELIRQVYISSRDKFITNKNGDWVIYITHEDTITFAGISLISKLKEWVDFEKMKNPWEK